MTDLIYLHMKEVKVSEEEKRATLAFPNKKERMSYEMIVMWYKSFTGWLNDWRWTDFAANFRAIFVSVSVSAIKSATQ